jgi:hypothetical protein
MPNPIDNPELYDVFVLAGAAAPGLAEVTGAGTPRGWDERKGLGLSGATLAQVGDGLPKFTVYVYLWEADHFRLWDAWKPRIARGARGSRYTPMDVFHPDVQELGIARAVVLDWKQRENVGEQGLYRYPIEMQEWRKPLPVYNVPAGSSANGQYAKSDSFDDFIKKLAKQAKDLL